MDKDAHDAIAKVDDKVDKLAVDIAIIKGAILGNGTKGLATRVNDLECGPEKNRRFVIPILISIIIALSSLAWNIIDRIMG